MNLAEGGGESYEIVHPGKVPIPTSCSTKTSTKRDPLGDWLRRIV
jgi:hypothetical protein